MNGTYGVTIAGGVAVITLTVPALWWVAVTMLAGLFLTFSTVRDWVSGVFDRAKQGKKQVTPAVGMKIWE